MQKERDGLTEDERRAWELALFNLFIIPAIQRGEVVTISNFWGQLFTDLTTKQPPSYHSTWSYCEAGSYSMTNNEVTNPTR